MLAGLFLRCIACGVARDAALLFVSVKRRRIDGRRSPDCDWRRGKRLLPSGPGVESSPATPARSVITRAFSQNICRLRRIIA